MDSRGHKTKGLHKNLSMSNCFCYQWLCIVAGMKRAVLVLVASILLAGAPLGLNAGAATSGCDIKILEIGTAGLSVDSDAEREAQDLLIVRNSSVTTSFTVQMVYIQSSGVRSETGTMNLGTIAPNATKTFVAPLLAAMNPDATVLPNLSLSSAGGTVLVQKTTGAVYCDQLGWGQSALYESSPAPAAPAGSTLARDTSGIAQDTNNNATDFVVEQPGCGGVQFSEIQPFVTDAVGDAIEAWTELWGRTDPIGNCTLVTGFAERYIIPQVDMPNQGSRRVIRSGLNAVGQREALHMGETGGSLWLADRTLHAGAQPIYLPVDHAAFPAIERGQTWSLVDDLWRATYAPTPEATNVYIASAPIDASQNFPPCANVRISEMLPNAAGDDADNEWVELYNPTTDTIKLAECALRIGSDTYYMSDYDGLTPGEYHAYSSFSSDAGAAKSVSIRNTSDEPLLVSWTDTNGSHVWQSFYIYDGTSSTTADEGAVWARFDDGWRWVQDSATPGRENSMNEGSGLPEPTESAAAASSVTDQPDIVSSGMTITITELLPNPAAPLSDDTDEYIELFNPNTVAVDLRGYTLQTGTKFSYSYTFPAKVIDPGAYLIVMSKDSSLLLSNTTGVARLLDPSGAVVSQTDVYTDAAEGVSWAIIDGVWKWTAQPTQATTNSYAAVATASTKKAAAAKTAKTAKTATAKASKSSGTTKAAKSTDTAAVANAKSSSTANKPVPVHTAVLAAVGVIGVLYAAYEYRTDIANYIYKLRSHRAARSQAGSAVAGR